VLTYQEIVIKLRDALNNHCDIECIEAFNVDFYTLFNLPRFQFNEEKFNAAYKTLALLAHPDKGTYTNKAAFMQYINNARDTLKDPNERHTYDESLPFLPQERSESSDTEAAYPEEHLPESPFSAPFSGPAVYAGPHPTFQFSAEAHFSDDETQFQPKRRLLSGANPFIRPRNPDTQHGYLMFFCITDGSVEEQRAKANKLIKQYVEEKQSGTGHTFHNNQLSNRTKTVTFDFSQMTEYQFDDPEENFLIVTLSTEAIVLNDALIKKAGCSYTEKHPECKKTVAKKSILSCCFR